jgi:hypothetical protein
MQRLFDMFYLKESCITIRLESRHRLRDSFVSMNGHEFIESIIIS